MTDQIVTGVQWVVDDATGAITGYRRKINGVDTAFALDSEAIQSQVSGAGYQTTTLLARRPTSYAGFASGLSNVDNSVNLATYCQLVMIPKKYSAVRLGWIHQGGNGALSGLRMVAASTTDIGDLSNTNTTNGKRFVTPYRDGAEQNALSFAGWKAVTWGGAATGSATDKGADNYDVVWSDVTPVQALPLASDPTNRFTGYYPLLVRVFPGSGFYSRGSYVGFSDPAKFLAECGPMVVLGANRGGGDHVATPSGWSAASTPSFGDSAVMPLLIEAYGPDDVPSVLWIGDSRFGSAPNSESATHAYRTMSHRFEQASVADGRAVKTLRVAQGGKNTTVFYQRANEMLLDVGIQPTVAIALGYSINDGFPTEQLLAEAKARVVTFVDTCRKSNKVIPLLVPIFPSSTAGYGAMWTQVQDFVSFCAGLAPIVDPLALYGGPTGAWLPGWAEDDNHMTPAGQNDLAGKLYAAAKRLF